METNDIVRKVAEEMLNTSMQDITAEVIYGWATRLGEVVVAKTETTTPTCKDSLQVGNAAKMREALENIRQDLWDLMGSSSESLRESLACKISATIRAALSAPPRNCDLPNVIEDPHKAWLADKDNWNDLSDPIKDIDEWLLAEAKGEVK